MDLHGNPRTVARFQCNLVVRKRRSAADVIRGVRNASALYLTYGPDGLLQLGTESSIAVQQSEKPECSNSQEPLAGGWPAYEFGDANSPFSDIARRPSGEPTLRLFSRSTAETPNRYTVEFQDEFNEYQQDSLSLVDVADAVTAGQEISASLTALGIPNFSQAGRVLRLQLDRAIRGNTYVEFETGVRGVGLKPGDLITLTYLKEGLDRQLFRIVRMAPGLNYRSILITAQVHNDEWYVGGGGAFGVIGGGRQPSLRPACHVRWPARRSMMKGFPNSMSRRHRSRRRTDPTKFRSPFIRDACESCEECAGDSADELGSSCYAGDGGLSGGRSYYYAISAVGEDGEESALSFVARATAAGEDTNSVTLHDLSFAPELPHSMCIRGPIRRNCCELRKNSPCRSGSMMAPNRNLPRRRTPTIITRISTGGLELLPETSGNIHSENSIGNEYPADASQ